MGKRFLLLLVLIFLCNQYLSSQTLEHAEQREKSFWTVSTNTLYIAALSPNIEFSYHFSNRWSLGVMAMCPWWSAQKRDLCYQLLDVEPEIRYYTSDNNHKGFYIGLFGQAGMYDLEKGVGYQGEFWGGSLSLGWTFSISQRFSLNAALGGGYISTQYRKYQPVDDCYAFIEKAQTSYLGPTKIELSLVWRIGK